MSKPEHFFDSLKSLIAQDRIAEVLSHLKDTLENSPKLNELLLQSAKYAELSTQIRKGILDYNKASQEKAIIRENLLGFIEELQHPGCLKG